MPELNPFLSVVIPTMGREILIRTLGSLAATNGFDRLEVIVAGRVGDPAVCKRLQDILRAHPNVRHLDIQFERGDSSRKKNEGAAAARAPLIAFLDDDVVVAPDWPAEITAPFADDKVGLASGPSLVPDDLNWFGRLAGLALSSRAAGYVARRYRQNRPEAYETGWEHIIGCNAAYRRAAFEQMGGFPEEFYPGEEMIAAFRTQCAGWKLVFAPSAWVLHYPRQSPRRFWQQMWGYGATRIRLLRAGVDFNPWPLVPGLWVGTTLLLALLAGFWPWAACLLALDLALYAAVTIAITLRMVARTRQWRDLALLWVIPFMHIAYGLAEWTEWLHPGTDFSETPARKPTPAPK